MPTPLLRKPLHYDAARRRLWIYGQRCHHGATGALLAAAGSAATLKSASPTCAALVAAGTALMAHDWHDRGRWFERGWQSQA